MKYSPIEKLSSEVNTRAQHNQEQRENPVFNSTKHTLAEALRKARYLKEPIFCIRAECLDPEYEHERDRVQRMRRENHPLISGGKKS